MGRKKDITVEKKTRISALLETGQYSQREISRLEGVSVQTVHRIAILNRENIPTTSSGRPFGGRKSITTPREDRKIIKIALANRRLSSKDIQKKLAEEAVQVSERTVRRRLYAAALKCRRPLKKPRLTPKMKQARYNWAKEHQDYSVDDWAKVGLH